MNTPDKTHQRWFEKAVRGMHSQGWEQAFEAGACVYRAKDGKRCAVGHIISDKEARRAGAHAIYEYVSDMGGTVDGLVVHADDLEFLIQMQEAHDTGFLLDSPELRKKTRRETFVRLADKFGLNWPDDVPKT